MEVVVHNSGVGADDHDEEEQNLSIARMRDRHMQHLAV